MGTTITTQVQIKRGSEWVDYNAPIFTVYGKETSQPFSEQNYGLFGFLADVRNYAFSPVLSAVRGLPKVEEPSLGDAWEDAFMATEWEAWPDHGDNHSGTWFLVSELLEFDYDIEFENRRDESYSHNDALVKGQGSVTTVREHIGQYFFDDIEKLKSVGNPEQIRVVISFCG